MKIIWIILLACLFYLMAMIDSRELFNPIEDCKIGRYTFSLHRFDCKTR